MLCRKFCLTATLLAAVPAEIDLPTGLVRGKKINKKSLENGEKWPPKCAYIFGKTVRCTMVSHCLALKMRRTEATFIWNKSSRRFVVLVYIQVWISVYSRMRFAFEPTMKIAKSFQTIGPLMKIYITVQMQIHPWWIVMKTLSQLNLLSRAKISY